MKKNRLLNPQLSRAVASLGHGQSLSIADCGLPIGPHAERIDLALTHGVPSFMDTLEVVLSEMAVEQVVVAQQFSIVSPELYEQFEARIRQLEKEQGKPVEILEICHEFFKVQSDQGQAVVRTGECTPYANVILKSGVTF